MTLSYRCLSTSASTRRVGVGQPFTKALNALRDIAHEFGDFPSSDQQDEHEDYNKNVRPTQAQ
jgi:hypothetical protein